MSSHAHDHSLKPYMAVFLALMVLTIITVAVAYVDLGAANNIVALTIACIKASLVIVYFMHVKQSGKLVAVFAFSGFFWVLIMLAFTWSDITSREWLPAAYPWN